MKFINTLILTALFAINANAQFIPNNSITTSKIKDAAVTSVKANFSAITIQKFTSGSGTYTTPAGVKWIRVRMVGGGSGGAGSGTSSTGGNSGAGGNTTFGTTLLVANGGALATGGQPQPGAVGGTASLGTGPIGLAIQGSSGSGSQLGSSSATVSGGFGGASPFGDGGKSLNVGAGIAPIANTGAGGGGGGSGSTSGSSSGAGGGAGGYVDAIIYSPLSTYAYAVGAAGTAGAAGTSGAAGSAGSAGFIIVEEHYQ